MTPLRKFLLLLWCAAISAACTSPAAETPSDGSVLHVTTPDGRSVFVTQADLDSLPEVTIQVDGRDETGVSLLDVLTLAETPSFDTVTLTGNRTLTLDAAQITPSVILSQTNRGKPRLAAESLPRRDWVTDITLIEIE